MHIEDPKEFRSANGDRLYVAPQGEVSRDLVSDAVQASANEEWEELPLKGGGKVRAREVSEDLMIQLMLRRGTYSLRFFVRRGEGPELEECVIGEEPDPAPDLKLREVIADLGRRPGRRKVRA